jgi:hypothetical protein
VCTPACLLAASISVEAVTPPLVGLAILKELLPDLGAGCQAPARKNFSIYLRKISGINYLRFVTILKYQKQRFNVRYSKQRL